MHTFTAKHVLYAEDALHGPLGVQVYITPDGWRSYEASADRTCQVSCTLLDGSVQQHTFADVDQVDLVQEEGFDPYYRLNFWFESSS